MKRIITTEQMIRLLLEGKSYRDISKVAGISRQRVQQLTSPPSKIKEYIHKKYQGECANCGKSVSKIHAHIHHKNGPNILVENYNDIDNLILLCIPCHMIEHKINYKLTCKHCGKEFEVPSSAKKQIFCSIECRHAHTLIEVECSWCGKMFMKQKLYIRRAKKNPRYKGDGKRNFCSRKCHGAWLGKNYGGTGKRRAKYIELYCYYCGKKFNRKEFIHNQNKKNKKYSGKNRFFCSHACFMKYLNKSRRGNGPS